MAAAGRDLLEPALRFLWDDKGVPVAVQEAFAAAGYVSLTRFSLVCDTRQDLRELLRAEYALDPGQDPRHRVTQAAVIDAWEHASLRAQKEREEDAVARVSRLPRPVNSTEHAAMRRTFEAAHYPLEDAACPSESLLELLLEQLESNDFKAIPLTRVTNRLDVEDLRLGAEISREGIVRIRRGTTDISLPGTAEDLRRRLQVYSHAWMFAALRHPQRVALQGLLNMQWAHDYIEYILGSDVAGLVARAADGTVVSRPAWSLVLEYEYGLRRRAAKAMSEGLSYLQGLQVAKNDMVLKERTFTTPMAVSAVVGREPRRARSRSPPARGRAPRRGGGRGPNPKGRSGGKSRGKGGRGKGLRTHTPDHRPICFAYNAQGCSGSCGFVHVCRICMQGHPASACPGGKGAAAAPAAAH